jgi:hypothetical protein
MSTYDTMPSDLHDFFSSAPKDVRIDRSNDLDLSFVGWLVAKADIEDYTRTKWTEVHLWLSTKGTYVAQIQQGGTVLNTVTRATAQKRFEDVLAWMREDNRGNLGGASKKVVAIACERLPWLEGLDVEHV